MKRFRVAVIGGGLAGLCAARTLERRGHNVIVLEAGATFGGQIRTENRDGYVIEHGAEGFVARSEALPRLAHALGIGHELCSQTSTRTLGYRQGELHELAQGEAATLLGFQVPKEDLGQGIRSLTRGMGSMIDALRSALAANVELRIGWDAAKVTRRSKGYLLESRDGTVIETERVVLATSAKHAARALGTQFGPPALALATARTLSSVTVSLGYARAQLAHPLDATGFVVATEEQQHGARACAFVSSKFAARAAADKALLRVFFRPSTAELTLSTDASFAAHASDLIARVLRSDAQPERTWVSRWVDALPVFDDGHRAAVAALESALEGSGVFLAGSAFHGAGIDAAVRSAQALADRVT